MTNEELLKEAKRRYPVGTKFKSSFNDDGMIREIKPFSEHTNVEFSIVNNKNYGTITIKNIAIRCSNGICTNKGGCSNPLIYLDGKWAEIVELPKQGEESLVGRYLKALVDNPQGIYDLKKGQYARIKEDNNENGTFEQIGIHHNLGYSKDLIGKIWELMPEGWTPEQENTLKKELDMFKKGDYIVTLKVKLDLRSDCAKNNYCFKQIKTKTHIVPELDIRGDKNNGNSSLLFDKSNNLLDWRYATPEEIAEYDRLGKPYDVTKLKSREKLLEEAKKRYPIGTVVISAHPQYSDDKMKVKDFNHPYQTEDEIYFHGSHDINSKYKGYNPCIYHKGKWAEIVTEKEEWIPKVGDWAYILGTGHTKDNSSFPKGKVFKIREISKKADGGYYIYVDKSQNPDNVLGECTSSIDCRKALPHEIPQESSNSIPEYVEITEDLFSNCGEKYKKGKIYKAYYYSDDFQGFIWMKDGKEIKDAYSKKYFKPSTKSEYLKQQYPLTTEQCISNNDIIEVGDEVEIIKNGDGNFSSNFTGYRFIVREIYKGLNIYLREFKGESTGIDISYCKLIKKASQTTYEKQVAEQPKNVPITTDIRIPKSISVTLTNTEKEVKLTIKKPKTIKI